MLYANNKDADQPALPRSLISIFVVHCVDGIVSELWLRLLLVALPGLFCLPFCYIQSFKTLAYFWSWRGRFESYLVENPEDRFFLCCFSILLLFLAHLSRRLIWWAYRIGRPPSSVVVIVHTLWKSSPQKPLGQSKSNFIWSFYGIGEQKFAQMVLVTWPRWPPCPYMLKTSKILLFWNQKADDLETWYASLGARVLPSLLKWWPWVDLDLFYSKVILVPYAFVWEKDKTMDFSETIVVCDVKVNRCS